MTILKKSLNYIDSYQPDSILLSIALSNLAKLYQMKNKYFKALSVGIQVIKIMEKHMNQLKKKKNHKKLIQDAVILINSMIICRQAFIMINKDSANNENKYQFCEIIDTINDIGYRYAFKYLGQDSILTKQLSQIYNQHYLPVYYQKHNDSMISDFGQQIINKLQNIEDLLKKKQQKHILVEKSINTEQNKMLTNSDPILNNLQYLKNLQENKQILSELQLPQKKTEIIVEPLLQSDRQMSNEILCNKRKKLSLKIEDKSELVVINSWFVQIIVIKDTTHVTKINIKTTKSKQQVIQNKIFQGQNLFKWLNQLRWSHYFPWECTISNITDHEIRNLLIKNHLSINHLGIIEIYSHNPGILKPFIINFYGSECIIFVHYVKMMMIRLVLCPRMSALQLYLDVQLTNQTLNTLLQIPQFSLNQFIVCQSHQSKISVKNSSKYLKQLTQGVVVLDQSLLQKISMRIIDQFQGFIRFQQEQICFADIFINQNRYFKYKQIRSDKGGMYYNINYLPTLNSYDIFVRNDYLSQSIEGLSYARGRILYNSREFYRDFGIPFSTAIKQKKLKLFASLISQKYALKVYNQAFTIHNRSIYDENAIVDRPMTFNSFKIHFAKKDNYCFPIMAIIVSIDSHIPIGIKIVKYDLQMITQKSYFIHLYSKEWLRDDTINQVKDTDILFNKYIDKFPLRKLYFLAEWMENYGFNKLLHQTIDNQSIIYYQKCNHQVIRYSFIHEKIFT